MAHRGGGICIFPNPDSAVLGQVWRGWDCVLHSGFLARVPFPIRICGFNNRLFGGNMMDAPMTDTTRPTVERTLRLAVTNRHITPAIERLALAILERAETVEDESSHTRECYRHESYTMAGLLERAVAERDALQSVLRSIANNTCCDGCQEAARVARAALPKEPTP
jgi:hypothetical protein